MLKGPVQANNQAYHEQTEEHGDSGTPDSAEQRIAATVARAKALAHIAGVRPPDTGGIEHALAELQEMRALIQSVRSH